MNRERRQIVAKIASDVKKMRLTPAKAVSFLNSLMKVDPHALERLFRCKVGCSEELSNHPTVQVGFSDDGGVRSYRLGPLGLLNGLFGVVDTGEDVAFNNFGPIVSHWEKAGDGSGEDKLLGFSLLSVHARKLANRKSKK